jgi:hypothetical protein
MDGEKRPRQPIEPIRLLPNPSQVRVSVLCSGVELVTPQGRIRGTRRFDSRRTLLISGEGHTLDQGELTFRLTDTESGRFLYLANCGHTEYWAGDTVITSGRAVLIASALSENPVLLTCTQHSKAIDRGGWFYWDPLDRSRQLQDIVCHYDLAITVRSWNLDSTPAPRVRFGWLCIADGAGFEREV